MIYLYAVTEPGLEPPPTLGLDDERLHMLGGLLVGGLYSRHERERFDPEPEAAWRHDRVVEAAMANGPVLPTRFGTTFAHEADLSAALEGQASRLQHALERVRGCVELAVRVSLPTSASNQPGDGRQYVEAKLTRRREQQAAAELTLVPLASHAVRSRTSVTGSDAGTLTGSYLVRVEEVDRFAERVRTLADRHAELSLSCTGPWAPYSFVGEEP